MNDTLIPHEKTAAVARGLGEAFGVTDYEDIAMLNSGLSSALVFRIVVKGCPYLLRVILRKEDPTRHFDNMRAAAEAGLAPRVRYTNVEDKVAITEFLGAAPLPLDDALVPIAGMLRKAHSLPPFAGAPHHINTSCLFLLNEGPALDGFFRVFRSANVLPQSETEELLALHAQLAAAYRREEADWVSSHNDLKPENIVFDGERVWLIDWEAAFRNDRYSDLAVGAHFVVTNEAEETAYLQEYFGQAPDEYQRARLFLMRQVSHLFYAMAYTMLGSGWSPNPNAEPGKPAQPVRDAPPFREFHRRLWAGEVNLRDNQMKAVYGKVHLNQLRENVRGARFGEAMRMVAG